MMSRSRSLRLSLTLALLTASAAGVLSLPRPSHAQDLSTESCVSDVYKYLSKEQRFWRAVLYGQKNAEDQPEGAIRYDKEGRVWLKRGPVDWASYELEEVREDDYVESEAEVKARRGLFEIRKASTSELLPAVTQALRAFQCRLRAVCELALTSTEKDAAASLKVHPPGCIEFEMPRIEGCVSTSTDITQIEPGLCSSARNSLLEREIHLLQLAIEYDAAYRSLLQFAGTFEGFLQDFRFPLLEPLWQSVSALSGFKGIPCFLSECSE